MADESAVTILVVDDDEAKRYAITKILQKVGFAIREAATGAEALRLVADLPDLVILDVKLPDVSGFEVCRRIKADPATASIPVLHLSTTFVDLDDKVQGLEGGADGYLTDVLEPLELIATVRSLLRARRAEEAAADLQSPVAGHLRRRQRRRHPARPRRQGQSGEPGDGTDPRTSPGPSSTGCRSTSSWRCPDGKEHSPFVRMIESQSREVTEVTLADRWLHVAVDPIKSPQGAVRGRSASSPTSPTAVAWKRSCGVAPRSWRSPIAARTSSWRCSRTSCAIPWRRSATAWRSSDAGGPRARTCRNPSRSPQRQVQHMARLLDDLLDVSRFTQGKIELQEATVDFSTVVSHAVETAMPLVEAKGHQLSVSLPAADVRLQGDPTRLEQVVTNLLNNAAKYTEPGGKIALTAEQRGQ